MEETKQETITEETSTEETEKETITIRVNPKEDFLLKEILSRVHEKKRTEFVKEAIFYWDYILKHSHLGTRLLEPRDNKEIIDNLFPEAFYINRDEPDMSIKEKFKDVKIPTIRFELGPDEVEIFEICSRAVSLEFFVKEAIYQWDCLLNTSNIFLSRYIKTKENAVREWHLPILDETNQTDSYYSNTRNFNNIGQQKLKQQDDNTLDSNDTSDSYLNNQGIEDTSSKEKDNNIQETAMQSTGISVGTSNGINWFG